MEELYREQILEHYKRPHNFGAVENPDLEFEDTNPFCGDEQHVTIRLDENDLCLMYTDGLSEVRNGAELFGEERVANAIKRDPGVSADVLCKSLLSAAQDFSSGPINDDVAILAVRKV